jgi:predicted DNA-binding protein with PD1-like motif
MMKDTWERDAATPSDYHSVEARRGREFVLRMTTGADVWLATQRFAVDNGIRFAKLHAVFMGGFQPARFLVWSPDTRDPTNWHSESEAVVQNLSMVLALGGIIHPRLRHGKHEPFPAIHFVIGGAWDVPTVGGHLVEGTIVKGVCQFFVTELLDLDVLYPHGEVPSPHATEFPENWYRPVKA